MPAGNSENSLRLDHFLKLAGIAGTGGQAKMMIQGGGISVNGEVETRRSRKLAAGEVVEVDGRTYSPDKFLSGGESNDEDGIVRENDTKPL